MILILDYPALNSDKSLKTKSIKHEALILCATILAALIKGYAAGDAVNSG